MLPMSISKKVSVQHFEVIPKTTVSEAAFEKLVQSLIGGSWREGDRIPPERELCQKLGIGRASLREALKALELIGMLESKVGDGTFVCPRSEFLSRPLLWAITGSDKSELRDLIEARRLLEMDIVALAAERATSEELQFIEEAVQDFRANITNPAAALEADMKFHLAVARAAHNDILRNSVQLLRNLMKHWLLLKLQMPRAAAMVLQQHEAICSAIRYRDAVLARSLMAEHLGQMGRLLMEVVDNH
jgi:GntR family transcriptional regulator, transcriptional repressor for pyruvate dehydrogenase complex